MPGRCTPLAEHRMRPPVSRLVPVLACGPKVAGEAAASRAHTGDVDGLTASEVRVVCGRLAATATATTPRPTPSSSPPYWRIDHSTEPASNRSPGAGGQSCSACWPLNNAVLGSGVRPSPLWRLRGGASAPARL
jgi:hypothetical protein